MHSRRSSRNSLQKAPPEVRRFQKAFVSDWQIAGDIANSHSGDWVSVFSGVLPVLSKGECCLGLHQLATQGRVRALHTSIWEGRECTDS